MLARSSSSAKFDVLVLDNSVNLGAVVLLDTEADRLVRLEVVAVVRHDGFVDESELEGRDTISGR